MKRRIAALAVAAVFVLPVPALAYSGSGTGFYISASGGGGYVQPHDASGSWIHINSSSGFTGSASVGYRTGTGFRLEIEGDYLHGGMSGAPSGLRSRDQYAAFARTLYDITLGDGLRVKPYVGIGLGYEWVAMPQSDLSDAGGFAAQGVLGVSYPVTEVPGLSLVGEYRLTARPGDLGLVGKEPGGRLGYDLTQAGLVGLRYQFSGF